MKMSERKLKRQRYQREWIRAKRQRLKAKEVAPRRWQTSDTDSSTSADDDRVPAPVSTITTERSCSSWHTEGTEQEYRPADQTEQSDVCHYEPATMPIPVSNEIIADSQTNELKEDDEKLFHNNYEVKIEFKSRLVQWVAAHHIQQNATDSLLQLLGDYKSYCMLFDILPKTARSLQNSIRDVTLAIFLENDKDEESCSAISTRWIISLGDSQTYCYWPKKNQMDQAKNHAEPKNWRMLPVRILGRFTDDWDKAKSLAARAEDTSNLDSSDASSGKETRPQKRIPRTPVRYRNDAVDGDVEIQQKKRRIHRDKKYNGEGSNIFSVPNSRNLEDTHESNAEGSQSNDDTVQKKLRVRQTNEYSPSCCLNNNQGTDCFPTTSKHVRDCENSPEKEDLPTLGVCENRRKNSGISTARKQILGDGENSLDEDGDPMASAVMCRDWDNGHCSSENVDEDIFVSSPLPSPSTQAGATAVTSTPRRDTASKITHKCIIDRISKLEDLILKLIEQKELNNFGAADGNPQCLEDIIEDPISNKGPKRFLGFGEEMQREGI